MRRIGPDTASRLAREGFLSQAEKVLSAPLMAEIDPVSRVQAARGEVMFALGRRREGLREMNAAWQSLRTLRNDDSIMAARFLSDALNESGNTFEAIQVLEPQLADNPDWPYGTTECEARLVSLYKTAGRNADAQAMELKIRQHLSVADADHPLLASMRTPQSIAPRFISLNSSPTIESSSATYQPTSPVRSQLS